MSEKKYITADRIFTGDSWKEDYSLVVVDGIITDAVQSSQLPPDIIVENFKGQILAPAFIDLQIYGAGGRLLAEYPDADSLQKLTEYCAEGGAAFCMPTVATNEYQVFYRAIDAIRDFWKRGGKGVLGLHIEGPWINVKKRGAHIESLIHSPTEQQVKDLLDYGRDVIKIITLAPEVCSGEVIKLILKEGIIISAGHSNATYEQAQQAFASGITTNTHLFNAMSALQHRAPGLVGACLDHESAMASIIPDGYHVDFAAIRIAKKIMKERLFVITDAVTDTKAGYYPHQLAGDKYESGGILSGSALNMIKAYFNLVDLAGISPEEALRMCSLYPARVIGADNKLGKLEKGFQAQIVAINENTRTANLLSFW
jgi:N-acetylglucosamine-6-phosphate deacetylase